MANPFGDDNATYQLLINGEGQYSQSPTFLDVPRGWTVVHPADSRQACLEFVNENWKDMRPRSLIREMGG